ncbi:MAG: S-formylglutathione hydrolase [Rhodospirillales bacterium]
MSLETLEEHACFGGTQGVYAHDSKATGTRMTFSVYLPPQAKVGASPVLYYLSGLTCSWENATVKAGAQRYAAEAGLILVFPDTSPRGDEVPDVDSYDFGKGAGFYVDATEAPWSQHYQMLTYCKDELPALVEASFPADPEKRGITGHSMGGHGALTLALANPGRYGSLSALAPIVNPAEVPWGQKALGGYLGENPEIWRQHDACALLAAKGWQGDILIDQGAADQFLGEALQPERFAEACSAKGVSLDLRLQPGYDHSYYFVSSFIADHIAWHAARLG